MTADKGEMWNHNFSIPLSKFKNQDELIELFDNQLLESGFTIFGKLEKKFGEIDFTVLWGLSESHLACHSFSETDKVLFQLSSCNYEKYRNFLDLNARKFGC